jgi:hypothetical protein
MNQQTGLIATIASVILVGCPSCFCLMFGAITAAGQGTATFGDTTQPIDPTVGVGLVCLSLIGLLIPFAVWFLTMRGKSA